MVNHQSVEQNKETTMRFNEVSRNPAEDESGKWDIDDTRRPRLTLRHLNKMRNMQEMSKMEYQNSLSDIKMQYGASESE